MMARQHVTFAVGVAGTALATTAYFSDAVETWVTEHWPNALLMLLLIAGGALVPDIDHHSSTITKRLGWLGAILHGFIRLFGIRHRGFFHSIFFAALSGLTFWGITALLNVTQWAAIFLGLLFLFYASVTFAFLFGSVGRNPVLILALAVALFFGVERGVITADGNWLAIGAFAGPLLHSAGDMLTRGKVTFFAPFSTRGMAAPLGFATGGILESVVLRVVFFVWSLAMIAWVVLMGTGRLAPVDFTADQWWSQAMPYLLWRLA